MKKNKLNQGFKHVQVSVFDGINNKPKDKFSLNEIGITDSFVADVCNTYQTSTQKAS